MDLRNKNTSEFSTIFDSPLGVPNSQVSLYFVILRAIRLDPPPPEQRWPTEYLAHFPFDFIVKHHSLNL